MNLQTRLTLAMVALVLLTAGTMAWLTHAQLKMAVLPGELDRIKTHARQLAADLDAYAVGTRADVLANCGASAVKGILRARLGGGVDPRDDQTEGAWRQRLAESWEAELAAKPAYLQFRYLDEDGREIVRVDRSGPGGAVRVVPDEELQSKGDREYFRRAIERAPGEVYVSPIELNRERGVIEDPRTPVLRVATPVHADAPEPDPSGRADEPFGVLVINVDMRPAFDRLRLAAPSGGELYVVNDRGDYLVHPDSTREFGFDLGRPARIQEDFPAAAGPSNAGPGIPSRSFLDECAAHDVSAAGRRFYLVTAPARLANGPQVTVVETWPHTALGTSAAVGARSGLTASVMALLCALGLAVLLARSLAGPLGQMTRAVETFTGDRPLVRESFLAPSAPKSAGGEVGVLARAFERMAADVLHKTAALRREIDERRRAEESFRLVVESSPSGMIMVNETGAILLVNAEIERMFGADREELLGQSIERLVPDRFRDRHPTWRRDFFIAPEARPMGAGRDLYALRKDGSEFPVEVGLNPFETEEGRRVLGTIVDITARKRIEEELRQSQEKYRGLYDNAQVGLVRVRFEDSHLCEANRRFVEMFGYADHEELYGDFRPSERLVDPGIREGIREELRRIGKVEVFEALYKRKDGSLFWGRSSLRLSSNGQYVDGVMIDITEQKRMAEEHRKLETRFRQSQKMEAVGQLAGGVAHDFNNILTAILGHVEVAEAVLRSEPQTNFRLLSSLRQIEKSALSAADLTRQLLAFSRQQVSQPRPLNLNDSLTGLEKMLGRLVHESIQLDFMPELELSSTLADPAQIEQVIMNLVVNARDAMPDGGRLTLKTENVTLDEKYMASHPEMRSGPYVLLTVSDTGVGMDAATMERIFEPFFTTKAKGHGTGLGLATVHGIVSQARGYINVYSEPGHGTTFRIFLPAIEASAERKQPAMDESSPPTGSETILLCEDNELVRWVMENVLKTAGYTVLVAEKGRQAVKLASAYDGPLHLLITDVVMPDINGKAVADELTASRSDMKVLYVSGYTSEVIAHHGVLDQGVELLEKPFTRHALLHRVRRILDRQEAPTRAPK